MPLYSKYFRDMFVTAEMLEVFSEKSQFSSWLETEAAIAKVQGMLGMIPENASAGIQKAAKLENLNMDLMREEYLRVGFPILPLVQQLTAACDEESARWVHWGATTQDIIDTGLILQIRRGLNLLEAELLAVMAAVASLADEHRNTVMTGRTFKQQAVPITFGFKAAIWLDELQRHFQRLQQVKSRALVCSYGGAVGNLSALGDDGYKVVAVLAQELDLVEPPITWHTSRDGLAEIIYWLASLGSTLGKIGNEVAALMSSEIAEVREPYQPGRGASSTMPQKRNPIVCPIIIAASIRLRDVVPSQLTAMVQDHERAVAGQPIEWLVIPEAFILASGVLYHAKEMLEGLEVDAERMRKNLALDKDFLMSESVMMRLAPKIGRGQAHKLVSESSNRAIEQGTSMREQLVNDERVMKWISESVLNDLLQPSNYLGSTKIMINKVINNYHKIMNKK